MPEKEYESLKEDFLKTLKNISSLIDLRNRYEANHSQNVAKYAVLIAKEMGLSDDEIENINYASFLHDIGKLGIKEGIFTKPDNLTDIEREIIAAYPEKGAEAISGIDALKDAVPLILHHHDWYKDEMRSRYSTQSKDIPLGAYIISVAEVYVAMISDRPYRKAIPKTLVISSIEKGSGTQFCPQVVDALLRIIEKEGKGE